MLEWVHQEVLEAVFYVSEWKPVQEDLLEGCGKWCTQLICLGLFFPSGVAIHPRERGVPAQPLGRWLLECSP